MKTQCSHCSAIFDAPDFYLNKEIKCLKCKKLFVMKQIAIVHASPAGASSTPLSNNKYVCKNCGTKMDVPKRFMKGSGGLELLLWLFILWPIALLYSIWRRSASAYSGCPNCQSANVIPVDTPLGVAISQSLNAAKMENI